MKIGLDMDGVLADVMSSWLSHTNPGRLAPLAKSDMDDWDFWSRHSIKKRDFYAQLDACWDEWESLPPTEGNLPRATAALSELADAMDIVTARSSETNRHVKAWLERQDVAYDKYVHVAAGWMKADLDYDVFIDDSPINADAFVKKGKKVVLYDQPWNAGVKAYGSLDAPGAVIVRVSNLAQAADAIRMMYNI